MHRIPAHIHRVGAGVASRGVTTPVPLVYLPVSLTGPDPSGSPESARLCRGCSHRLSVIPENGCLQLHPAATTAKRRRSPTSIRNKQRLVAHCSTATIRLTHGPRVIHVYGLTRTNVNRRHQAAPQFSPLGPRKILPHELHVWHPSGCHLLTER